jgi:hypothetical protein
MINLEMYEVSSSESGKLSFIQIASWRLRSHTRPSFNASTAWSLLTSSSNLNQYHCFASVYPNERAIFWLVEILDEAMECSHSLIELVVLPKNADRIGDVMSPLNDS